MPFEPVARLLKQSAELAGVRERLARVAHLQARFRRAVPESLLAASRVSAVDGSTVVIGADNGSVAAALRAVAPRLLAALQGGAGTRKEPNSETNQEVTAIRVEVQVTAGAPVRVSPRPSPPSPEQLSRLAEGLSESPLREALERMAEAQRSRKTRSTR